MIPLHPLFFWGSFWHLSCIVTTSVSFLDAKHRQFPSIQETIQLFSPAILSDAIPFILLKYLMRPLTGGLKDICAYYLEINASDLE